MWRPSDHRQVGCPGWGGGTGEHPGTHRVPRRRAAGLTRAGGCSGLCPWRAVVPRALRCLDQSTELPAQSCEQGQDLGPRGVVERLPACGEGKAGQAGSLQAADKRARGPSPPSRLSVRVALLYSASQYWSHLVHTLSDASPAEWDPHPSDSPWDPSTQKAVCTQWLPCSIGWLGEGTRPPCHQMVITAPTCQLSRRRRRGSRAHR